MKTKTFLLTALVMGCLCGPLLAQVDTTGKKQNKKDSAWNKNRTDTGWNKNRTEPNRNRRDTNMNNTSANQTHDNAGTMPDLSTWPETSRMAAEEMISKYGNPDASGSNLLAWKDKDQWKTIRVSKEETEHNFPVAHTDMMEQSISYKVPPDKVDDLARFDGSVIVDRTQGLLSARCDKEANNILALNLAHDIITGKKTVDQARKAYGTIVKEKLKGGDPEYMKQLVFTPKSNTEFTDVNTTGLDKKGNPVAKQ